MLSGLFYHPTPPIFLYPTCQYYELWVISLGKVCREAGSCSAAIKCSNWAFNHADILTALNLSPECTSESVTVGSWLDHQNATPDHSEAEWDEAVNGCRWENQSAGAGTGLRRWSWAPRRCWGHEKDVSAAWYFHSGLFWFWGIFPSFLGCLVPVRQCWSLYQKPVSDRQEYTLGRSKVTPFFFCRCESQQAEKFDANARNTNKWNQQ